MLQAMHLDHLVPTPLLLLLLQTASVLSSPATHVYKPNCAPPDSATTPATTTADYIGLYPIEYCCPETHDCKHLGGFCALNWIIGAVLPKCDYEQPLCKDYGCTCCIKCGADKCSKCTETGGNCRTQCRSDEMHDLFSKCTYPGCYCCKKCTMKNECIEAKGTCAPNHYDCPGGTAASSGCCGGCFCCKPELQKLLACERKTGSYCAATEDGCVEGYYACFGECEATSFHNGLRKPVVGYCCSPKTIGGGKPNRIGVFEHYLNIASGNSEDLVFGGEVPEVKSGEQQLDELYPRPIDGGSANERDEVYEDLKEDQIYDEVVPLQKKEQQDIEITLTESKAQSKIDNLDSSEVEADIEIQNIENKNEQQNIEITLTESKAQSKIDNLDSSEVEADIEIQNIENVKSDSDSDAAMAIDSPIDISDQVFNSDNQIDENNKEVDSKEAVEKTRPHWKKADKSKDIVENTHQLKKAGESKEAVENTHQLNKVDENKEAVEKAHQLKKVDESNDTGDKAKHHRHHGNKNNEEREKLKQQRQQHHKQTENEN
ncbi:unnamed protein product [Meganyctiphanes norvegica]|uniref:Uncharacterized protein n=1 Tax=Meganyctiphanes norvegica TaxID=48144 RepID=A0AAV2PJE7_MEGNR